MSDVKELDTIAYYCKPHDYFKPQRTIDSVSTLNYLSIIYQYSLKYTSIDAIDWFSMQTDITLLVQ